VEDNTALQSESAGRRAAAYWFIDGLPEILFGIVYIVWGSVGLVWGFDVKNSWMKWGMVAGNLAFLTIFIAYRPILDTLKSRLTYPRTGYVRPPAEPAPQPPDEFITLSTAPPIDWNVTAFRMRAAFIFFVASQLVSIPIGPAIPGLWRVPVIMAVVAAGVYLSNRRDPHPYSWQSTVAIAVAGLLSAGLRMPPKSRPFIPLLIGGVWLLAHGVPTLVRYLRTYPAPKSEGE
jgi:hypothetical protein